MKNNNVISQLSLTNGGTVEDIKRLLNSAFPDKHVKRLRYVKDDLFIVRVADSAGREVARSRKFVTEEESVELYNEIMKACGGAGFILPATSPASRIDWAKWEVVGFIDFLDEHISAYMSINDVANWH